MTDPYPDYGFSCVRCWHADHYHTDHGCTAKHNTTHGPIPCECRSFYHRKTALDLLEQTTCVTSDPVANLPSPSI